MADWKQITARIRRAKGSKDPAGQLSNLFLKTRDAMVAFELARHFEATSKPDESVKWYAISWQRFRRGDWKTKAQEAVARLGGSLPAENEVLAVPEIPRQEAQEPAQPSESVASEAENRDTQNEVLPLPPGNGSAELSPAPQAATSADSDKRGRGRGRRGGRNRRKPAQAGHQTSPSSVSHSKPAPPEPVPEIASPRVTQSRSIAQVPVETVSDSSAASTPVAKGRFGDPGLSSRLSLLEMQFRRLLACPPAKLDQADRAPAGPGVFVLTDEEMTTYYYVEACDTLRIATGNLVRGSGHRRSGVNIKPLLADHLGIPEVRVGKYLTEHCVVRWLQLDEGAEYFAHFVIAILRPILNSQS